MICHSKKALVTFRYVLYVTSVVNVLEEKRHAGIGLQY